MPRCNEVSRLIASGDLERAHWATRARVWLHLRMCEHCRRYALQIKGIGRAARELFGGGEDESAVRQRLERAVLDGVKPGSPPGRDSGAPPAS